MTGHGLIHLRHTFGTSKLWAVLSFEQPLELKSTHRANGSLEAIRGSFYHASHLYDDPTDL
jgi:hypothetical protein